MITQLAWGRALTVSLVSVQFMRDREKVNRSEEEGSGGWQKLLFLGAAGGLSMCARPWGANPSSPPFGSELPSHPKVGVIQQLSELLV